MEVHCQSAPKRLKIKDKSGYRIENNAVISTTQVGGGGRSLERTRLWPDFPVLQGKNWEFRGFGLE